MAPQGGIAAAHDQPVVDPWSIRAGASIQLGQGARAAGGGPGNLPTARGPHSARRARPRGAQLQLGCSRPSALRVAWNQRRAAVAGWGREQARRIRVGPATGRASPPERFLPVCSLPIHRLRGACGSCMLRYQARQLRWRKRRVAAASSGLVSARPTLLGASFACDFDPSVPDATQVRRRDATCRKLAGCANSKLISVRSYSLWRLTGG